MSLLTIPAKDIMNYIGKSDTVLIDLRTPDEYARGHIPTAINLPYEDEDDTIMPYPTSYKLVLICSRGNASLQYGRYLSERGYEIVNICGGIRAYKGKISVD